MIDITNIDWAKDSRSNSTDYYLSAPETTNNKFQTFRRGWQAQLTSNVEPAKTITWNALGQCYASILGDATISIQIQIYLLLLKQFVHSPRCKNWTDDECTAAIATFVNACTEE